MVAPVVPVLEPDNVDVRFVSPFMAFLASLRASLSDAALLETVVACRAVEVPAEGRAGGLARLLPAVARVVELAGAVLCADEAVPAIAGNRAVVPAAGRLGAADVAGAAFFARGTFVAFLAAGVGAGLFGVSTCSTAASEESAAVGTGVASGSAMSISRAKANPCRKEKTFVTNYYREETN